MFLIPSMESGGMERVMSELVNYLSKNKKEEIHLVLYGRSKEYFYRISNKVIIHSAKLNSNNKFSLAIETIYYIRKKTKEIKPSVILSFGEVWNCLVLVALLGIKYPIIISDRCEPGKSLGVYNDFLRKKLYPHATAIIAQTEFAKSVYLNELKFKNIHVIGNPIQNFSSGESKLKENIVLTVGRLIPSKHHEELIKIFMRINNSNWKLMIVGGEHANTRLSKSLNELIVSNGFEHRIFLNGKEKVIGDVYRKCKIFAFPSSSEGFPNVVGEAMSAGLPVIAFDQVVEPSGLIKDEKHGLLIPYMNFEKFADGLSRLICDEGLRETLSENALSQIKKFYIDSIGETYYKVLRKYYV
jgi:GalNAc-alpha-(1->4)-GalNAc-alpha-(1->3)-diNAcBac-PP-undecaprenol alpha-1,4-N-acetyl-D-galactosaminyltransferase